MLTIEREQLLRIARVSPAFPCTPTRERENRRGFQSPFAAHCTRNANCYIAVLTLLHSILSLLFKARRFVRPCVLARAPTLSQDYFRRLTDGRNDARLSTRRRSFLLYLPSRVFPFPVFCFPTLLLSLLFLFSQRKTRCLRVRLVTVFVVVVLVLVVVVSSLLARFKARKSSHASPSSQRTHSRRRMRRTKATGFFHTQTSADDSLVFAASRASNTPTKNERSR